MEFINNDDIKCAVIIKDTWLEDNCSNTITTIYIKENLKSAYEYMVRNVEYHKGNGNIAYIADDETLNGIPIKCVIFDGKNNRVSNWELAQVYEDTCRYVNVSGNLYESKCGKREYYVDIDLPNFCPNCGARVIN